MIVLTLLVRDEIDIVDEFLRYHLELGVDFVVATDHMSSTARRTSSPAMSARAISMCSARRARRSGNASG